MDNLRILEGNACLLVKNTSDEMTRKDFEEYLKGEGFEQFKKYSWKDRGCFYINVNSLRYSAGVTKPAKLAQTIVGEGIKNPFTIKEFAAIWAILKRHIKDFSSPDKITKGTSAFLVLDEAGLADYLQNEGFNPLAGADYGRELLVVNVKSRTYSNGRIADALASAFIGNSSPSALTADDFKAIWDILKSHRNDCTVEELLGQCEKLDDHRQVIECCDKALEIEPGNVEALYYKAKALFDMKKYESALNLADRAMAAHPKDWRFCNLKAFMLTDMYRISEAIECYNASFYLGGFDGPDGKLAFRYRAECHLKKAREDFYIRKDLKEAKKSLEIYLNQFPDDDAALRFADEMSHGEITPRNTRYHEKLMYFECRAYELYILGFLSQSLDAYRDLFEASQDFKANVGNTGYKWFDCISCHGTSELDNFRWYDEVLAKCLRQFDGNYEEFFRRLFEVSLDNVSACVDKARLFSKIYREDLAVRYSKMIVDKCPQSSEAWEFYRMLCDEIEKRMRLEQCHIFRKYSSIDEYAEDVVFCLINSCRYTEKQARNFVKVKWDEVKRHYEGKYPADDFAMDYYPLCG